MSVTGVPFLSNCVDVRKDDNYFSIHATKHIPQGTIVLIEHVLYDGGDIAKMVASVWLDNDFMNELYPRGDAIIPRQPMGSQQDFDLIYTKILYNEYGTGSIDGRNCNVLGRILCKFNHSCDANCDLLSRAYVSESNETYCCVVTNCDVEPGTELTINYAATQDIVRHNTLKSKFGFSCSCTQDTLAQLDICKKQDFLHGILNDHVSFLRQFVRMYEKNDGIVVMDNKRIAHELAQSLTVNVV